MSIITASLSICDKPKHCGNQKEWKIGLKLLLKKTGSSEKLKGFRQSIKSLVTTNELPDYSVAYDLENDIVIFTQKRKLV